MGHWLKVGPPGFLRTGCGEDCGARGIGRWGTPCFLLFQAGAKGLSQAAKCYTLGTEREEDLGEPEKGKCLRYNFLLKLQKGTVSFVLPKNHPFWLVYKNDP